MSQIRVTFNKHARKQPYSTKPKFVAKPRTWKPILCFQEDQISNSGFALLVKGDAGLKTPFRCFAVYRKLNDTTADRIWLKKREVEWVMNELISISDRRQVVCPPSEFQPNRELKINFSDRGVTIALTSHKTYEDHPSTEEICFPWDEVDELQSAADKLKHHIEYEEALSEEKVPEIFKILGQKAQQGQQASASGIDDVITQIHKMLELNKSLQESVSSASIFSFATVGDEGDEIRMLVENLYEAAKTAIGYNAENLRI